MLATDGVQSFIIFLYADGLIQWTTGEDSGGINGLGGNAATAGYDAGDLVNFFNVPGSGTPEIINITRTSNVGNPGMWIFSTTIQGVQCFYNMYLNADSIVCNINYLLIPDFFHLALVINSFVSRSYNA